MEQVSSDHLQRRYLEELVRQADLDDDGTIALLKIAKAELASDHELAELLVGQIEPRTEALQLAYADAILGMRSDFETQRALLALLGRPELGAETLDAVVRAARQIRSDAMLAELLIAIGDREGVLPAGFSVLVPELASDYQHRRVLSAIITRSPDAARVGALLATADGIGSDYEMAELLVQTSQVLPREEALPPSFFTALATIDSDYEHRRSLSAALKRPQLSVENVRELLVRVRNDRLGLRAGGIPRRSRPFPSDRRRARGVVSESAPRYRLGLRSRTRRGSAGRSVVLPPLTPPKGTVVLSPLTPPKGAVVKQRWLADLRRAGPGEIDESSCVNKLRP